SFGGTSFSSGAPVIIARAEVLQGKVSRWTCRRTGRTFSQPNPALQPYARPMGVPQFNFRRVLYFANGQYLVSDDSADDWAFLCGECSVYAVAMNTADGSGYVLATTQFSPTTDGFNISVDPATDEWTMVVRNADTTQLFDIRAPRFLDTAYVLGYRAQDGHEDGDVVASIGGSQYTANSSDWEEADPASHTLYIGARPPGSVPWDGYISDIMIYSERLDDEEHARVTEELESWNIGSCSIPGCQVGCSADYGYSIDFWDSRIGGTRLTGVFTTDPADEHPAFRGALSINLPEAAYFGASSPITNLNSDHAVICCVKVLSDTTDADVIWEMRAVGTNTYEALQYASGQWVFNRRAQGGSTDTVSVGTADFRNAH